MTADIENNNTDRVFKWLAILIVLLFFAGAFYLYDGFYGNPLGAWWSRGLMERHLATAFTERSFTLENVHYNFKCGCYSANVVGEPGISFTISVVRSGTVTDDYKERYLTDHLLSERFTRQLNDRIYALLQPRFADLHGISSSVYVPVDTYPEDAQFAMGMERETPIHVEWMGAGSDRAAFARRCVGARDAILQAAYQPLAVSCVYSLKERPADGSSQVLFLLNIDQAGYTQTAEQLENDVERE